MNLALMEENARFRTLAEKLLAHPAFHPFLDELSRDPALAESLSKMGGSRSSVAATPVPNPTLKDVDPFAATAQQYMPQQNENAHIGMALIPETPLDLSSLNLGGGNRWAMPSSGMPNFQQPQVFAVLEVPEPAEPISVESLSGKGCDDFLSRLASNDDDKADYPEIETPVSAKDEPAIIQHAKSCDATVDDDVFDENDPTVTLYATSTSTSAKPTTQTFEPILGNLPCEKAFAHFELFVSSEQDNQRLMDRFEKMCNRLDSTCRRLESLTSGY
jgi:hypothetical protein